MTDVPHEAYPPTRAARDRFVLAHREARVRPDPFAHQGVLLEEECGVDGRLARTATVFLTGRECPWRCLMCDLWQYTTTGDTPRGAIPHQLSSALAAVPAQGERPVVIKLYNAGSYFDRRAVPEEDDDEIAEMLATFGHVIVESHPALVGDRTWRLRDALATHGAQLEVAMGLETAHPGALAAINKGITIDRFAASARALREHGVLMRAFVLIHPPFVPADDQREWLSRSVVFADACGATAVSLIPTRDGEGALRAIASAGAFAPPRLGDIEVAASDARRATSTRVFVDLWEIGRFVTCRQCAPARRERLGRFNRTQVLAPGVGCERCGEVTAA